jgi:alpha-beta hydrolase superfamily lysophospholipase
MNTVSQVDEVGARDGTALRIRHWPVATGDPWASMLLVHGLAEHSGRYEHVGAQLAAAGIDTYAFDLRGFGGSGGPRASVERWSQLHDDLEERLVAVRSIAPGRPLVLYGHSLGGLIALGYVLDGRAQPDLLVLSAPAIGATVPAWQRALVSSLRRVAPGMQLSNRLKGEVLSRDPAVAVMYFADPLNQHRSTVRFAYAAFAEQRRVAAALDRLSIQTLVIHGGADRLVPTASSEVLDGRPGVIRRVYPTLRHESHNEPEGPQVVSDIIGWVRERASRMHSPAGA